MADYSNIGKGGIVKEGIFVRFPDLMPAATDNYWDDSKFHKKLLIIGESNYFEDGTDSVFQDPEAWYTGEDTQHLIPEDKKVLVNNWKAGYKTFNNVSKSMSAVSDNIKCDAIYKEAMYYNYFLRPATVRGRNKSFKKNCKPIDREVAGTALCGIIELAKPDIVIFISKYAFLEFQKYRESHNVDYKDIVIKYVNHPAHPSLWYSKNGNGRQTFEKLLKEYWLR